ncbi:cell division protein FtsL [Moraxella sp.]|uniref:cell division protein FtsL n=1 Tax=Moraxella sp. TaxID=479 RepID=UPI0026DC91F3|nr:cell division protein FtsL [Moraxella sp.]MDO4894572.1 cell division protein FtsL [Moraxella sp.]
MSINSQLHELPESQELQKSVLWGLRAILAALVLAIFWTAIATVQQTHERHQTHIKLRELNVEMDKLRTEQQRLLIEQQTFSATPQVAQRAVSELGMFFPSGNNRRIITPQTPKAGE